MTDLKTAIEVGRELAAKCKESDTDYNLHAYTTFLLENFERLAAEIERLTKELEFAAATNLVWRSHPSHGDCEACKQLQAALEVQE